MIGAIGLFGAWWLLITYCPGLAKALGFCFILSLILLIGDPALGAQFTIIWLSILTLILIIAAIPFVLMYLSGILFVALFFYGFGQLIK